MKPRVEREVDALYLRLDDSPIVESEEVAPGIVLDFNETNDLVGVEALHLTERPFGLDPSAPLCPGCDRTMFAGTHRVCFSDDRRRRYWFEAALSGVGGACLFLMLNPSSADEQVQDRTVGKCKEFAERGGYGKLAIVNLLSYRSPNPEEALAHCGYRDTLNERHVAEAARQADAIVCAWGNWGSRAREQVAAVGEMLCAEGHEKKLRILGDLTQKSQPPHPARLGYERELRPWLNFRAWLAPMR